MIWVDAHANSTPLWWQRTQSEMTFSSSKDHFSYFFYSFTCHTIFIFISLFAPIITSSSTFHFIIVTQFLTHSHSTHIFFIIYWHCSVMLCSLHHTPWFPRFWWNFIHHIPPNTSFRPSYGHNSTLTFSFINTYLSLCIT